MMDKKYWEKIAPDYNEEIFDVLANDRKGVVRSAILGQAAASKTVVDIGCAIGKWLPVLSQAFEKVIAVDISKKNLAIAREKNAVYSNITYIKADMSSAKTELPEADVAICINALLTDSLRKRTIFFKNLSSCVRKEGHLVLVVPSLESWLFTRIIQHQWKIDTELFKEKMNGKKAIRKYRNTLQGNMDIDDVPTKHYLKEEIELLLSKQQFTITACYKIEYAWSTEFVDFPQWLNRSSPWDWLCIAQKK